MNQIIQKSLPLYLPAQGHTIEVFATNSTICYKPDISEDHGRAFVLSVPKSGTYLVSALLSAAGLVDTEIHVADGIISDYRWKSIDDKLANARLYTRHIPLDMSIGLIGPGQFAVGHLTFSERVRDLLASYSKIFVFRRLRECIVSLTRFEERRIKLDKERFSAQASAWAYESDPKRKLVGCMRAFGAEYLGHVRYMQPWLTTQGVLQVRFEDLMGDNGAAAQRDVVARVCEHMGESRTEPEDILRSSLGQRSLTFSGQRSRLDEFWSDEAEDLFEQLGGLEIERLFAEAAS